MQEDSDPEQWLEIIDKREQAIGHISEAIDQGFVLPKEWEQQYAKPYLEIDNRVIPLMQEKQDELSDKIDQLKRGQAANKQYGGYSGSPAYGAFFDTKK